MIIIDGGLSNTLPPSTTSRLWCAQFLLDDPQAIYNAHSAYLNAGAHIITTSSYQASFEGFKSQGAVTDKEIQSLFCKSVELAHDAIANHLATHSNQNLGIALSVGCFGAHLCNGSEYTGQYPSSTTEQDIYKFHHERIDAMLSVDSRYRTYLKWIAFETIPNLLELKAILNWIREHIDLLMTHALKVWISFCCRDESHLSSGELLKDACLIVEDLLFDDDALHKRVVLGVNCVHPRHVDSLLDILETNAPSFDRICYPNSGEEWDDVLKEWRAGTMEWSPREFAQMARSWTERHQLIGVGGCCRIGPDYISQYLHR